MTLNDADIIRAAKVVIKSRGHQAAFRADARADELCLIGDLDGEANWRRIAEAIRQLQSARPTG